MTKKLALIEKARTAVVKLPLQNMTRVAIVRIRTGVARGYFRKV